MTIRRFLVAIFLTLWMPATGFSGSPGATESGRARAAACFVNFQYDTPAGAAVAKRCAAVWQAEGAAFTAGLLPSEVDPDTVICLVLSSDGFVQKFGDKVPDWGVGVALGPRLIALDYARIPAVGRGVREIFLHEMAHALLFQGAGRADLPAWFHEGVAMRAAGEWRFWDTVSLVFDGRVPDLSRLQSRWPSLAVASNRAYRTSLLAVNRLRDHFGPGVIAAIVAETRRTGSFAAGFSAATDVTLQAFYADFNGAMRLRFGWVTLLSNWPGLFALMAMVLAVGAVRKIIVSRRRLAAMEDEEDSSHSE